MFENDYISEKILRYQQQHVEKLARDHWKYNGTREKRTTLDTTKHRTFRLFR